MFPWVIPLWRATDAFPRRAVPKPDIIKRLDLWVNTEFGILENLVIFLVGVERRIEADQIDTTVEKVRHNIKAIAVIERIGGNVHSPLVDCSMRVKEYPFLWV